MKGISAQRLATAALLAAACLLLHFSALSAGWSHDDPPHLRFVTEYSPWQYFGLREVMLEQSYAHITPWNALFYAIGLPWAGLDARWHHVHLLAVIWGTAYATQALLRRWLNPGSALLGAFLFLAMPPTGAIAQTLMTGHYAYGMLWTVLAIHAWVRAIDRRSWSMAVCAAVLYGLACLCKELYVPLPAALLFMPLGTWRLRLGLIAPVITVAVAYMALRFWVLHGIGGYAALSDESALRTPLEAGMALLHGLQSLVLGVGAMGMCALGLCSVTLYLGWRHGKLPPVLFTLTSLGVLLLPTAPLFFMEGVPYGASRVLVLWGWACAVLLAWQLNGAARVVAWPVAMGLLLSLALGQRQEIERVRAEFVPQRAEYQFLIDAPSDALLVPDSFLSYSKAMQQAVGRIRKQAPAQLVDGEDSLLALGPERGRSAWAWRNDCACLRALGADYDARMSLFQSRLAAGAGRKISLDIQVEDRGRQKILRWAIDGHDGTAYFFDGPEFGRFPVSRTGVIAFGLDTTVPLGSTLPIRVTVETPDGAWVRSPQLVLPLEGSRRFHWSTGHDGFSPD